MLNAPGYSRTEFLSDGSIGLPQNPMPEYGNVREMLRAHREDIPGNQPGDPGKLVDALIELSADENPPLHLLLGTDAYGLAEKEIEMLRGDMEAYREVSHDTDFA